MSLLKAELFVHRTLCLLQSTCWVQRTDNDVTKGKVYIAQQSQAKMQEELHLPSNAGGHLPATSWLPYLM